MQIYFHSRLCSYLPRVPILVEGTVSVNILMLMKFAHFVVLMKKRLPFYCDCTITNIFGVDLSFYIFNSTNMTYSLILKDIFFYYKTQNRYLLNAINFFIYSRLKVNLQRLVC